MPRPTLHVVAVNPRDLDAPFIRGHIERLPADTVVIHGFIPTISERPVLSDALLPRLARKAQRIRKRLPWSEEITRAYAEAFAERPGVVLAEYGPTGVRLVDACLRARVPLVVHFHGYDASVRAVLDEHRDGYRRLFEAAAAIIVVSRAMERALLALGAPRAKVHYCAYGVDCEKFTPGDAASAPPVAVAVGRLVDKKAPHLTILAFSRAQRDRSQARLRIVGDGPLLGPCMDLVSALGLQREVVFLGHQPHDVIRDELRAARCFVQHSVQALNGDCEGTPNAVLEAGASGLPSVVTRHAGILDVVRDGETGFLVEERDVEGMAAGMSRLFADRELAGRMGAAARAHMVSEYALDQRLAALWSVIEGAAATPPAQVAPAGTPRAAASGG